MTHIEVEALWQQTERECLGLKDWAKRSHFAALVANAGTEVLREQLAKSCSEDQRHAFGGCPIANGLAARVAELEADLQNYGFHAVTCVSAWPDRACDCGFKEAIDRIGGGK